jgi:hypothetical protein
MLPGCGCLIALLARFAPRVVIILAWLFSDRWSLVWDTWLWPLLGFFTLYHHRVRPGLEHCTGISGWDRLWIGLGVMLDIMKWA